MVTVVIIALDGCLGSAVLGSADSFRLAAAAVPGSDGPSGSIQVVIASPGGEPVMDGHGRRIAIDADLFGVKACAAFLVPGFMPASIGEPPDLTSSRRVLQWMRDRHANGSLACGSCSGAFALGDAGLLNGRRCTTTWWLHDAFRHRYPAADPAFGSALVQDGRVMTAGGPFSWIDLVLALLERLMGPQAARRAADFAVVDGLPRSQTPCVPVGYSPARHPFPMEVEHFARHASSSMTTAGLARALGLSERTLYRRLKAVSNETPRALLDRIRFDRARLALESGNQPVKQIADACGYMDESSFRRAFKRAFGKGPADYRRWAGQRRQSD